MFLPQRQHALVPTIEYQYSAVDRLVNTLFTVPIGLGGQLVQRLAGLILVILLTVPAIAQVPSSEEPAAAAARFATPRPPASVVGNMMVLPTTPAPGEAARVTLRLEQVQIVGSSVFKESELEPLYGDMLGTEISVADLYGLAQRVTAFYGDRGYVLSRGILPEQEIDPAHATVTIQVLEGYVDAVEWPADLERYRGFFSDYARHITAERPSNINTVMRYLLLARGLPGLEVESTFRASETNTLASTLVVTTTEKPVDLFVQFDNRGTEGRGPWQYLVSATFNNLLGQHEALSTTLAGSTETKELTYAALGYEQVLTSEGLFGFADASYSWGEPGTAELEAVEFASTSLQYDIGIGVPLVRSRDTNLTLSTLFFASDNKASMLGSPSSDDRLRGARVKLEGEVNDDLEGRTIFGATLSHGFEGLGSSSNGDPLLSRGNGRVDFVTLAATVSRDQKLGKGWSILAAAEGQYAFTPLLSPEECGYGGKMFGRAFDPSEITGDSCLFLSGELRFDPDLSGLGLEKVQLYGFTDWGVLHRSAPSSGSPSTEHAASAGAGVRIGNDNFDTDLSIAKPLLGRDDDAWRFFLSTSAKY